MKYRKILLAYNGSQEGKRALLECADLATFLHAETHLLAVASMPPSLFLTEGFVPEELLEEEKKRTRPFASAGLPGLMSSAPPRPLAGSAAGSDFRSRSFPVKTAIAPGWRRASLVSIETISACARSERRKCACAWPGRFQSETYRPRPVSMRSSSSLPFSMPELY